MKRTFLAFAALGLLASSALAAPAFFEPLKTVADFKLALTGGTAEDAIVNGLFAAAVVASMNTENNPGFVSADAAPSTTKFPFVGNGGSVMKTATVDEWGIAPPARKPIHQTEPADKVAVNDWGFAPLMNKPIHIV